jgi:hypothetical protein
MFGFGRSKISVRAQEMHKLLVGLKARCDMGDYSQIVSLMTEEGFETWEAANSFQANRTTGMARGGHDADMSIFLTEELQPEGDPSIKFGISGHLSLKGILISGGSGRVKIFVDNSDAIRHLGELGRDAEAMNSSLLKMPGITSQQKLKPSWGIKPQRY